MNLCWLASLKRLSYSLSEMFKWGPSVLTHLICDYLEGSLSNLRSLSHMERSKESKLSAISNCLLFFLIKEGSWDACRISDLIEEDEQEAEKKIVVLLFVMLIYFFHFILGKCGHLLLVCKEQPDMKDQLKDSGSCVYVLRYPNKWSICDVEMQVHRGPRRNIAYWDLFVPDTHAILLRLQTILQGKDSMWISQMTKPA